MKEKCILVDFRMWSLIVFILWKKNCHTHCIQNIVSTMSSRVQKVMTQPINLIFRFLQNKARIQIWLYENTNTRIEGRIIVRFRVVVVYSTFRVTLFSSDSYHHHHQITHISTHPHYIFLLTFLETQYELKIIFSHRR